MKLYNEYEFLDLSKTTQPTNNLRAYWREACSFLNALQI